VGGLGKQARPEAVAFESRLVAASPLNKPRGQSAKSATSQSKSASGLAVAFRNTSAWRRVAGPISRSVSPRRT